MVASLVGVLPLGCKAGNGGGQDGGADLGGGNPDQASSATFVRLHYSLGNNPGQLSDWGVYWFGAGSTSPDFNNSPKFSQVDNFGVYRDIEVTDTNAFLGLIPIICNNGSCSRRDVQTEVRYADLPAVQGSANIHEAWIVQGRAVSITRPDLTLPQYRIFRPSEFIDLGNGSVRLTFRVAPGSTGTVSYGTSQTTLNQTATWTAANDINKNGLVISGLTPGTTYYYRINTSLVSGTQTYTDQSPVQSLTPISFSTVSDAADWAGWGNSSLMYQIFVRTFADGGSTKAVTDSRTQSGIDPATRDGVGDLVGLRNTLPYLKDLGVDAIWMTPVFKARSYHGYDTTDFYDIDPSVGTIRDFVDLTEAAHGLGIRIIVDFVINHVADVNPWFTAALNPSDPEYATYRDWFVYSDDYENILTDPHPFDSSAVIWACRNYRCYHQIFGSSIPELNFHNPVVRAKMKDIAKTWLERGADGFRLDASKHIDQFDENNGIAYAQHGTHVWWKEFNYYVKKQVTTRPASAANLGQVILAGENRYDALNQYQFMIPYAGDMDSQFDFPFRTALSNLLNGQTGTGSDFIAYINQVQIDSGLPTNNGNTNHFYQRFLSNHDLDRPASQFASLGGAQLTGLLRLAASAVFTVPGMPVIYYGEEFGKQGQRDMFNGIGGYPRDEFIREPMSWFQNLTFTGNQQTSYDIDFNATNTANATLRQGDPLNGAGVTSAPNPDYRFIKFMQANDPNSWAAQRNDPNSLYSYYKKLVQVRKATPLLTDPTATRATVTNSTSLYEFRVTKATQSLSVVMNRTSNPQTVTRPTTSTDLLTNTTNTSFTVPPYGTLILQ
jgi:glycosidase